MTMTTDEITNILQTVAGHPTNGPVADIIPAMAQAIADAVWTAED